MNDWVEITEPVPVELVEAAQIRDINDLSWRDTGIGDRVWPSGIVASGLCRVRFKSGWVKVGSRVPDSVARLFRSVAPHEGYPWVPTTEFEGSHGMHGYYLWDFSKFDYWFLYDPPAKAVQEQADAPAPHPESDADFALRISRTYATHLLHLLTPQDAFRLGRMVGR